MFTYLKVKNFALIEDIEIEFKRGFTAFVGETGAGKSLLVDAISILSGARSSISFLKKGTDYAYMEGGFFLPRTHGIYDLLAKNDIMISEGEDILVSRKISKDGRTVCKIQGNMVPVLLLKQVMTKLIDIHGQQENNYLLEAKNHLFLLDIYGKHTNLLSQYKGEFAKHQKILVELEVLTKLSEEVSKIDQYEKQLEEVSAANIHTGEIETLNEQFKELKDFSKNFDFLNQANSLLQNSNISESLFNVVKPLEKIASKSELVTRLNSIYYDIEDIEKELAQEVDAFSNQKLQQEQLEKRIAIIFSLQKKYGDDLTQAKIMLQAKIDKLQNVEFDIIQLKKEAQKQHEVIASLAIELTHQRIKSGEKLSLDIMEQLTDLYMENVVFAVKFFNVPYNDNGSDGTEFMLKSNIGSDFQPMAKIASGGELSRIMLAIKVIFSKNQTLATIIFDEIDTGVSGKVAEAIARKMQVFGSTLQVFAITHLPQVLAASTQQLLIEKYVQDEMTYVKVNYLTATEHAYEVAKMLSGSEIQQSGVEHAQKLIASFKEKK
ncbi:recombination and repair protein RecN [Erysipelotrichaceae bacterium]|nr:recombination and repair protein RecN [Erysipelotrichaceae bacterium]